MIAAYFGLNDKKASTPTTTNIKENSQTNDDLLEFFNENEIKQAPHQGPRMIK